MHRKLLKDDGSVDFEQLFYMLPGHVYFKNPSGRYLACNELQASDLGLRNANDISGKTDYDLSEKEEAEKFYKNDQMIMDEGKAVSIEENTSGTYGQGETWLSHKVPIKGVSDELLGLLGISLDISELKEKQKRQESEHKELQTIMTTIMNSIPEHIYWMGLDNKYLGCNKAQAITLKLKSTDEIKGKSIYDFEIEKDAKRIIKNNQQVVRSGRVVVAEEPYTKEDGSERVYLSKKVPLKNEIGQVEGIVGISFDITAEKENEQLRLAKERAEKQAETTRLIATVMAHELRTPLRAVDSGANALGKQLQALIETYQKAKEAGMDVPYIMPSDLKFIPQVVENIKFESKAAFSVVDMLLVKAGLSEIKTDNFTTCSMRDCIEKSLERYPFRDKDRDLIHWDKGDFKFHGDELLIIHVLFNLIKNALHYVKAARKGEITITAKNEDGYNILIFKDTGAGIPDDIMPHIFEQFFSNTAYGTGVGLAFCKIVMESMQGRIECTSKQGEYTKFVLYFKYE
jgi:PAS domain S-box-containing protein